jgi:hypothetical protein
VPRSDPVPDSIFDQWLENQMRYKTLERCRVSVDLDFESLTQSRLLDFQILPRQEQLFLKGHFVTSSAF